LVLSACETGLGESVGGEGVLGLRRAFVLAGTENLVMSLWSVPDRATCDLITAFYKHFLNGEKVSTALLYAQRESLARQRQSGKETNPFEWAAFVATGIGMD
jgi:CHAT domain-containing protein